MPDEKPKSIYSQIKEFYNKRPWATFFGSLTAAALAIPVIDAYNSSGSDTKIVAKGNVAQDTTSLDIEMEDEVPAKAIAWASALCSLIVEPYSTYIEERRFDEDALDWFIKGRVIEIARNPKDNKLNLTEEECLEGLKEFQEELLRSINEHEKLKNDLAERQQPIHTYNPFVIHDPLVDQKLATRIVNGEDEYKINTIVLNIIKELLAEPKKELPNSEDTKFIDEKYETARLRILTMLAGQPEVTVTIKPGNLEVTKLLSVSPDNWEEKSRELTRKSRKEKVPPLPQGDIGTAEVTITGRDGKLIEEQNITIRRSFEYLQEFHVLNRYKDFGKSTGPDIVGPTK